MLDDRKQLLQKQLLQKQLKSKNYTFNITKCLHPHLKKRRHPIIS